MQIMLAADYSRMSAMAADLAAQQLKNVARPLICVAAGTSPAGFYKALLALQQTGGVSMQHWSYVSLDEWLSVPGSEKGSSRNMMDEALFIPGRIQPRQIKFFDGLAAHPEEECAAMEAYIEQHGGIDMAILGLGMNGHVGLNEPGVDPALSTHVCKLSESTRRVAQKYFTHEKQLDKGITLGIASLMKARMLLLIVSGVHKAGILQQALEGPVTKQVPASLLRDHPALYVVADAAAASLLKHKPTT
ncbi:MAG TPA: glucosamine-6-phosphate deaminase [Chitinophagaceae bacterium]|nr:glucosamine-6-phosphate deaminase [Chitinophagaceae bacterium]